MISEEFYMKAVYQNLTSPFFTFTFSKNQSKLVELHKLFVPVDNFHFLE